MDSVVRFFVSGRSGMGISALLLLPLLMVPSGCHWGGRGATSPPTEREELAADNAATAEAPEWLPPAVVTEEAKGLSPSDNTAIGAEVAPAPPAGPGPEAASSAETLGFGGAAVVVMAIDNVLNSPPRTHSCSPSR